MTYCNLPESLAGPYNQTLFLGCSISNFNCNLGWGPEGSTLTVSLVEDNAFHRQSFQYGPVDTTLNSLAQQTEQTPSASFTKNGDSWNSYDPAKTLHKTMVFSEANRENERDRDNITLSKDNKDFGKVCYDVNGNRVYWTGPDPFFIGASGNRFSKKGYDIMGVPVRFKFNNFVFGGMVTSYSQVGSQQGLRSYEVEIKSFASLLEGVQLITAGYAGTVCGVVPNTSNNPTKKNIATPMPYGIDFNGNGPPIFSFFPYNADVSQGNIPNVLNIYGYLTYIGYKNKIYGNAGINNKGIRSQYVYDALESMVGLSSVNNPDNLSPFSPYGALIAKSLRENETSAEVNPFSETYSSDITTINLTHMGICANGVAIDGHRRSRLLLDLREVPRPPKWVRTESTSISLLNFIDEICKAAGYEFFVDFVPPDSAQISYNVSGVIKIRTVSRKQQPRKDQIQSLVDYMVTYGGATSYSKGKEYSAQKSRSMYVGGKQKRLLQVRTERIAYCQNTLIWDPWIGQIGVFIEYSPASLVTPPNLARAPNLASTRRYAARDLGGVAVVSDSSSFNNIAPFGSTRPVRRGNYDQVAYLSSGMGFEQIEPLAKVFSGASTAATPTRNIPLYTDAICPYFGVGSNGLIRKVFFDKNMGQMQILFPITDLNGLFPYPLSYKENGTGKTALGILAGPLFLVLENEIRAAGAGFEEWLAYCFGNIFSTDISEICYKSFKNAIGLAGKPAEALWIAGIMNILKENQIIGANNIILGNINLNTVMPYFSELYNTLKNVHSFFADIANEYYGKKYMVRMPALAWYQDYNIATDDNDNNIILGTDEDNNPIYAWEGSGSVFASYNISSDGAWEEPGNIIDDTMAVGGINASIFTDDQGKINPIVGYNASMEMDNGSLLARQLFLTELVKYRPYNGAPYTCIDWAAVIKLKANDPTLDPSRYWYIPLMYNIDESILLPYPGAVNVPMAHNQGMGRQQVPSDKRFKMYAKATVEPQLQYIEPNYIQPRAILSVPGSVSFDSRNKTSYDLAAVMIQDSVARLDFGASVPTEVQGLLTLGTTLGGAGFAAGSTTIWGGLGANPAYADLANRYTVLVVEAVGENVSKTPGGFSPKYGYVSYFVAAGFGGISPMDYIRKDLELAHMIRPAGGADAPKILPRAAHPLFCAVPVECNDAVYGPWINHPGLIMNNIFPDSQNPILDVENLVGGVNVTIDPTLSPWEYGGMEPLDYAVAAKIAEDVTYQHVLEKGSVTYPGFANFNIGYALDFYGGQFNGPILSSINVQIDENGINTTYGFRTYTRKIGFFNKEAADQIKAMNQQALKTKREIDNKILALQSKMGRSAPFRIL